MENTGGKKDGINQSNSSTVKSKGRWTYKFKFYLKNKRTDYPLNGLGWGINFRPDFHKNLNLIIEHDTKTLNVGAIYSLWADHFNFLFELQDGKYVSCGLVYKVNLKGGNRWKSGIFDY